MATKGDRKPRNYYVDYTKGIRPRGKQYDNAKSNNCRYRETPDIAFGHRGFLITSMDEVKSYLEMRNILEDYFEQLHKNDTEKSVVLSANQSIEDDFEAELKHLQKVRPFKQVKTHCRNTLFINIVEGFPDVDPVKIVDTFFDDMAARREMRSSNTFKVLPILDTFRNSVACAKESVGNLIKTRLADSSGPQKYFIEFQSRGNYKMCPEDKQKMIEEVANTIGSLKPEWTVSRDGADFMVVLVALKNVCCVSFLRDYFRRCKYNVIEYCKEFMPEIRSAESVQNDHES